MSNKIVKNTNPSKRSTSFTSLPKKTLKEIVALYVFLMFSFYPLWFENKYYNMGDAKWHYFHWVTLICVIAMIAGFIWYQIYLADKDALKSYWNIKASSMPDRFVLAYGVLCIISTLLSPYKSSIIVGYTGWYMGLIAQLAFVLLYYFVSRFWRWDEICIILYLSFSSIVFLLGILNRFMIDPLQMYVDLDSQYIINFLSTLGQATWYSSYMVIIFPIGLFAFWYYNKKGIRISAGLYVALGSMTMITQNSDSAFAAFAAIFVGLFCYSFRENRLMKRFFECLIIMFASWKFMGLMQMAFPDQAVVLSNTMFGFSKGNITWILLAVSAICYALMSYLDKKELIDVTKLRIIRTVLLILIGLGIAAVVVYIILNTSGALAGTGFESDNNYLKFDTYWGNNRGSSWMITVKTFCDCSVMRKLFGAGPDGFYNLVYEYHSAELIEKWGENTVLTCAHNEWLTALINVGLFGAVAYIGIFISSIIRFTKKSFESPEVIAASLCILAYMAHNFFCYQQIICTPIIFMIIGGAECICRYGKRHIWEDDGV